MNRKARVNSQSYSPLKSDVAIVPTAGKQPKKPLILLDPDIASRWGRRPEDVFVYQEKTLAKVDISKVDEYRLKWQDVNCVTPDDLFFPELKFIDCISEAIPGGLMPETAQPIVLAGEHITPLIPVSSLLLEYFTPEELVERMKFRAISGGEPQVEVSLDLPLTGTREAASENYRLTRIYPLKQENALANVPVLQLWPNFRSKGWKAYYALFFDLAAGSLTFRVSFPEGVETELFKDDLGGNYSLTRMETFPSSIECLNDVNQVIGLILPKQPPEILPQGTWKVGVDFNADFTNIFVGRNGRAEPLTFDEELLTTITESPLDTRFATLFNYFMPDRFLPVDKPLPLSSVLTTRGSKHLSEKIGERAILDGRVYNPSTAGFDPQADCMETELSWDNFDATRLFLKNIILLISANAAKQGAKTIDWRIAYSSHMSNSERHICAMSWRDLTRESATTTGLNHHCDNNVKLDHFICTNRAVGQYFCDSERLDLIYSSCLYISSNASDVSIWQDNEIIYQCSLKFSGRDFLSDFLELNPAFLSRHFGGNSSDWSSLRGGDFRAKLDVLLRWESENWLKQKRPTLTKAEDVQGLVQLMSLGFAGVYYYIGLVIRALKANGTYKRQFATPVYLAGSHASLIHWLDATGNFTQYSEVNLLLSRILSRGADIEDTEEGTWLSQKPKDEVACGLVLDSTNLKGIDYSAQDSLIPGESYSINGIPYSWEQPMNFIDMEEDIELFSIPNLDNLNIFLYEFHRAIKGLRIEGIKPLPGYKISTEISDNAELWRGTQRSLDRILQESKIKGNPNDTQMQPPFILGLKALLQHLGSEWAKQG